LENAEEKRFLADDKYLTMLGFTENPRLYPAAIWKNTSLPIIVTYVSILILSAAKGMQMRFIFHFHPSSHYNLSPHPPHIQVRPFKVQEVNFVLSQTLVESRSLRLFSCMKVLEYIVGFSKLLVLLLFCWWWWWWFFFPSPPSALSLILIFTVHKREVYLL
jgi:hypothetical protein